jgi:hypothetical protein
MPSNSAEYQREYYAKNRDKIRKQVKARYPKYAEKHRAASKEFRAKRPVYQRAYYFERQYGITVEDYNRMFEEQGGRCKICETHQSELSKALAVDHDHSTGRVRGLLCHRCNTALGLMNDDPRTIRKMIAYLSD